MKKINSKIYFDGANSIPKIESRFVSKLFLPNKQLRSKLVSQLFSLMFSITLKQQTARAENAFV